MYLLNVYLVFKVHEGDCFVPHLVGNENRQKFNPPPKKFLLFFVKRQICESALDSEIIKSTLDGCKVPVMDANRCSFQSAKICSKVSI